MKKLITISLALGLLWASFGSASAQSFDDVYDLHLNREAITTLQADKVVQGYSDGTFKPENRINRAEFAKILVASQVDEPKGSNCFPDVKTEWFAPYVCEAKSRGWVKGYPDGTFKPGDYINFAEASQIITKAMGVEPDTTGTKGEWFAGYVKGLEDKKAIPSTVQFFDKNISRGEMAEMVWRIKENKTDKVSGDYESLTEELPAIKSCEALKEKFVADQSFQYRYGMGGLGVDFLEAPSAPAVPAPVMESKDLGSGSGDFSQTNVQVKGVDEADVIKNDGKYIYMVKNGTVRIVDAFPPAGMKEAARIDFEDGFSPQELFVDGDRLAVMGQLWANYWPDPLTKELEMSILPRPWGGSRTKVYIFDIKDRTKPVVSRKTVFDGAYQTSRRIDNHLYLILNEYPNYWIMDNVKSGEDFLPRFQDGDGENKVMAGCADIHYFPGYARPNYLITASIPLDDPEGEIDREILLGASENVYSSRTGLYVATSEVNYNYYTDWDWTRDRAKTLVFRFGLDEGKITYLARGSVPGRILNQFSMDENKSFFRIATTIDQWSADHSSNNVYVLNSDMETVGKVEDIAPGERIYSTRFLGDRLYMVTFRQVDPFFVIDLSTPTAPKVLGNLKIPGFSNYLHPYDDNHIIGFGQDTEDTKTGTIVGGFKMALFDVSDVTNPQQKFAESIGDKGTYSELLNNHKALLFNKAKNLLAFPITIVEKVDSAALECNKYRYSTCPSLCESRCVPTSCTQDAEGRAVCTTDCEGLGSCIDPSYERFTTTFQGAVVYTLNDSTGFRLRGRLTHYDEADILKMGDYWPYDWTKAIQRILYMDDVLYSVSQGKIKASDINSVKEINALALE